MKKYIEREAVLDIVAEWCPDDDGSVGKAGDLRDMLDELEAIPAADVVEVRRGKWVWNENGVDWGLGAWECSECHRKPETWWEADKGNPYRCAGSSYCSNCGAKMVPDERR